ncbi:MAG: hypothetical protein J6866_03380 [Victivallales bacterium]|nr:hypothetical protein [Victivallales bacterium]
MKSDTQNKTLWPPLAAWAVPSLALLVLVVILLRSLGLVGRGQDGVEIIAILDPERGLPALAVLNGDDSLVLCPGQQEATAKLAEILHTAQATGQHVDTLYAPCLPTAVKAVKTLCEKVPPGSLAWYGENSQTEKKLAQALQTWQAQGLESRRLPVQLAVVGETTDWSECRPRWACRLQRRGGTGWGWFLHLADGCQVEASWETEAGQLDLVLRSPDGRAQEFALVRHSHLFVKRLRFR